MQSDEIEHSELDRAVKQTFPASDPVKPKHITGTETPGSDVNRQPPEISKEDVERAAVPTVVCPRCNGVGVVVDGVE